MTDTANLEDGFYWVRYRTWRPAEWSKSGGYFRLTGHNSAVYPSAIDEIDPRPIKREDVK